MTGKRQAKKDGVDDSDEENAPVQQKPKRPHKCTYSWKQANLKWPLPFLCFEKIRGIPDMQDFGLAESIIHQMFAWYLVNPICLVTDGPPPTDLVVARSKFGVKMIQTQVISSWLLPNRNCENILLGWPRRKMLFYIYFYIGITARNILLGFVFIKHTVQLLMQLKFY